MTIVSFHYYHIFKTDIKFVRIQKCLAQLHFVQLLNNVLLKNKVKTETILGKKPKFKLTKLLFLYITQVLYIKLTDIFIAEKLVCWNLPQRFLKHFDVKECFVNQYLKSG